MAGAVRHDDAFTAWPGAEDSNLTDDLCLAGVRSRTGPVDDRHEARLGRAADRAVRAGERPTRTHGPDPHGSPTTEPRATITQDSLTVARHIRSTGHTRR